MTLSRSRSKRRFSGKSGGRTPPASLGHVRPLSGTIFGLVLSAMIDPKDMSDDQFLAAFLKSLGIKPAEVAAIRRWSKQTT
jgi:hypothetical protein